MKPLLTLLFLSACQNAQDARTQATAQTGAASAAATLDPGIAPAGLTAKDFSVDATLDEYVMTLDDLVAHQGQATLHASPRRIYVMSAPPHYRAAVYMRPDGANWAAGEIHGNDIGSSVGDALATVKRANKADNDEFFLIQVTGLHLTLLGYRQKGALMLASTEDRPDLDLVASSVQPATQLLASISGEAHRAASESAKFFAPLQ